MSHGSRDTLGTIGQLNKLSKKNKSEKTSIYMEINTLSLKRSLLRYDSTTNRAQTISSKGQKLRASKREASKANA